MKKSPITLLSFGASLLLVGAALVGCNDTAKGAEKDMGEAGHEVRQDAKDAGAAVSLTPMVKSALVANPFLNESGNVIDVDSNSESVILKGHVKSEKNKQLATELAMKVLKDNSSKNKLDNQLVVTP